MENTAFKPIELKGFYNGLSPIAAFDTLTEFGNAGSASSMANVDVLNADYITQGPALTALTAGTQVGAVTELINYILDIAVANDVTYGIGTTKLFKISSTAVTNAGDWPHAITNCTSGSSVAYLKGKLYYLFNKASGGEIGMFDLTSTFDDDWGSTVPTGFAALQNAPHPVACKEDIMIFGNGRYVGVYFDGGSIDMDKLDFGNNTEVADVCFNANAWFIAVNSGITGTNRNLSEIYSYDGGAISNILSDEAAVGVQKIGFIYPINGVLYVAYQDQSTTGGYAIGYLSGRELKPLVRFTGSLPTFSQKTLYKNTILFISSGLIYSAGAVTPELPFAISQLADGGYATVGALAAPFGTPMVASYTGATFQLAKFGTTKDVTSTWKSVVIPTINGTMRGFIDEVIVITRTLAANARCDLQLEYDQNSATSGDVFQITGTGLRRFIFPVASGPIEDLRVYLNWANGNATNDCPIRKIIINGHFVES